MNGCLEVLKAFIMLPMRLAIFVWILLQLDCPTWIWVLFWVQAALGVGLVVGILASKKEKQNKGEV